MEGEEGGSERGWRGRRRGETGVWIIGELSCIGDTATTP